ncbi:MAG TPA: beta-N-acetylhexosaminidase [Micropepsaceae bacterium]|nr:beta-N-acetylhexosaminidase [Micropepsaceae bacterium]
MPASAAIYGCQGMQLAPEERDFFRDAQPFGFILFARNCGTPDQIRALCDSLRDAIGFSNAPILIDQEGGRVARLKPPHWRARPPARWFGELFERSPIEGREATYLCARLIANDLRGLGVTVNCAPVLDVPVAGAHDIIGDRAFSLDPATVIELGRIVLDGHLDGGVLPVIKHIPGHGRALADSHLSLPTVTASAKALSAHDFVTFRALNHAPIAMTAHVVYQAIDANRPATTSARVVHSVIRGEIGFRGLLISDDLSMAALEGSLATRTKAAMLAGCDIALHCNGELDEMKEVASEARTLSRAALRRAEGALAQLRAPAGLDIEKAEARLAEMTRAVA